MAKSKELSNCLMIISIFFTAVLAFIVHKNVKYQIVINASNMEVAKSQDYALKRQNNLRKLIWENQKYIVLLQTSKNIQQSKDIGILYNDKGDIITSANLVKDLKKVEVKMSYGDIYEGDVIALDEDLDLAVIRVPKLAERSSPQMDSRMNVKLGEEIIYLDNFDNISIKNEIGNISSINKSFYGSNYELLINKQIKSSGVPILDAKRGEVIGITTIDNKLNKNVVIPMREVLPIVEGWSKNIKGNINNNLDLTLSDEGAKYIVNYFYDSINSKDYLGAYFIMGNNYKRNFNYNIFINNLNDIESVNILNVSTKNINKNTKEVTTDIKVFKNGKSKTKKITFVVGFEDKIIKINNYFIKY